MKIRSVMAITSLFMMSIFFLSCASVPTHITSGGTKLKVTNTGHSFALSVTKGKFKANKSGPTEFIQKSSVGGITSNHPACSLSSVSELASGNKVTFKVSSYQSESVGSFHENEMIARSTSGKTTLTCWHDKNQKAHLTTKDISQAFGSLGKVN